MIPFIYKKPKPKACDPLGQERGSCRDTELVAAEQRPVLVPLLGLQDISVHSGGNNHFSHSPQQETTPRSVIPVCFLNPRALVRPFPTNP